MSGQRPSVMPHVPRPLAPGNCTYILRYFTQVPVELVVAIAEAPRVSSGQQPRVKVQMPERDDLIARPVIQIDRKGLRYTRCKVHGRLKAADHPASNAYVRCRN
jgi:hypothetical protein